MNRKTLAVHVNATVVKSDTFLYGPHLGSPHVSQERIAEGRGQDQQEKGNIFEIYRRGF